MRTRLVVAVFGFVFAAAPAAQGGQASCEKRSVMGLRHTPQHAGHHIRNSPLRHGYTRQYTHKAKHRSSHYGSRHYGTRHYGSHSRSGFSLHIGTGYRSGYHSGYSSYPRHGYTSRRYSNCPPPVVVAPKVVRHVTTVCPDTYGSRHYGAYYDGSSYARSYDYKPSVVTVRNPRYATPTVRTTRAYVTDAVIPEVSTRKPPPPGPRNDGWTRLGAGRVGEAAVWFASAVENDPENPEHLVGYAVALASQGDDETADWAAREAIRLDPGSVARVDAGPALRLRASSLRARQASRADEGVLLRAVFAVLSDDHAGTGAILAGSDDPEAAALLGALSPQLDE